MMKEYDVDTPIEASYDPWGRSVLSALRRWIALPIGLAILGAALGLVIGTQAKPSAVVLLRVESSASDGAAMKTVQESTVLELDTAPIYSAAASSDTTAGELRSRTAIAAVPDSQLITITVTAPTADQAVREADAISDVAIAANNARITQDLKKITDDTRKLIADNRLPDNSAEQSRVARLGDNLGQNQSNLIVGSRSLILVHGAEASTLFPSPIVLGTLGLVAGALLGGAIAILVGARRGRIRSTRELQRLYPRAAVIDALELESVINLELENTSTVYVAGVHQSPEELEPVAEAIREQFAAAGSRVRVVAHPSSVAVADHSYQVQVVPTSLSDTVVRRVARDADSLLIIPVTPRKTRLEGLEPYASRFNERTYLLNRQPGTGWS
jgi:hypothetical protein